MKTTQGRLNTASQMLRDILSLPTFGVGLFKVWLRDFYYFKCTWMVTAFWAVFEPVLYLFAIGIGLGRFVGQIESVTYYEWFFPGLLASTAMMVSFFETTYGSFTKLNHQKTFAAILLTPITSSEIVLGEILWATTKAMFGVLGVALVGAGMGAISDFSIIPAFGVLALLAFVFASLGMLVTSFASRYDSFIYAQSGFIMPMALFSGTYFPISQLPIWLKPLAFCLPLTHGVLAVRGILLGQSFAQGDGIINLASTGQMLIINVCFLLIMSVLSTNWAVARVCRKLVY